MYYSKEKRSKSDICNICEKKSDLTWDHVPPKNCFNDNKTEYNSLFGDLIKEDEKLSKQFLIAQNGIKFRSICKECNNSLLGAIYDIELKELVDILNLMMISNVKLPNETVINVNVNRIARSIIGHLLAAKKDYDSKTLIDKRLRKFFLDNTKLPPKDMQLLYYIYPYKSLMIVRDIVILRNGKSPFDIPKGLISCLSFYPIAFILCNKDSDCGLEDMFSLCTTNIDDKVKMKIDFTSYRFPNSSMMRPFLWPCKVSDGIDGVGGIMGGLYMTHSIISIKRKIQQKQVIAYE